MDSERTKLLSWWAMIRWFMVVVLFSIGLLHISFSDGMVQNVIFFVLFIGIVALNFFYQLQTTITKKWIIVFQIILDIVFATLVVHLTGGLNSFFVWVYLIGVITAALTIPHNGGVLAGLTGSMSLMVLILLYRNGIISPTEPSSLDIAGSTVYILSYTGLFCGVAMIANYLSDQLALHKSMQVDLEAAKDQLVKCQDLQKNLDELLTISKDVAHIDHDINTPLCVITLSLGRVKRYANELQNEGLKKSNNEITEAVNKISTILQRLQPLKSNVLVASKSSGKTNMASSKHPHPQSDSDTKLMSKEQEV